MTEQEDPRTGDKIPSWQPTQLNFVGVKPNREGGGPALNELPDKRIHYHLPGSLQLESRPGHPLVEISKRRANKATYLGRLDPDKQHDAGKPNGGQKHRFRMKS